MLNSVANAKIYPNALKKGDTLMIVCPASPPPKDADISGTVSALEKYGFKVKFHPQVYQRDYYLAGLDDERAKALMEAFEDPTVQGVMCWRGGYGCARIVNKIDLDKIIKTRKPFIGFSDITTLHSALNKKGYITFHGLMLAGFGYPEVEEWSKQSLINLLQGKIEPVKPDIKGQTINPGIVEGDLVGGCLTLLSHSIGTPYEFDANGKILVLEDTEVYPYALDRYLTHLIDAGKLKNCLGIVVGNMQHPKVDPKSTEFRPWQEIIKDKLGKLNIPVILDYPIGHIDSPLSLPLGSKVRLNANIIEGIVDLLESPVINLETNPGTEF